MGFQKSLEHQPSLLTDQTQNVGYRIGDLNCNKRWEDIQKCDPEKQALAGNNITTEDWDMKKGQVVVRMRVEKHRGKKKG